MAKKTKIEWCDSTFNGWIGCTPVSPACDHCYAAVSTPARAFGIEWGQGNSRHRTSESTWQQSLRWNRQHADFFAEHGRRRRVFCSSLSDVFDNEVDPQWRADLFELIGNTPYLDWLLLTKRIGNAGSMLPAHWGAGYANVWIGATIANQEDADRDIGKLLATPARVRFLSCEPLLGPVDLRHVRAPKYTTADEDDWTFDALNTGDCYSFWDGRYWEIGDGPERPNQINWVIAGGESGPRARPSHPDWFRSLRDQCACAGVAFHHKQHGEWIEAHERTGEVYRGEREYEQLASECDGFISLDGHFVPSLDDAREEIKYRGMKRVGKKTAGRTLDGQVWDQFPQVRG